MTDLRRFDVLACPDCPKCGDRESKDGAFVSYLDHVQDKKAALAEAATKAWLWSICRVAPSPAITPGSGGENGQLTKMDVRSSDVAFPAVTCFNTTPLAGGTAERYMTLHFENFGFWDSSKSGEDIVILPGHWLLVALEKVSGAATFISGTALIEV